MKIVLCVIGILCMASVALAGQKYNPYSGQFETVPDDYEIKYNPYDSEFSYESPEAQIEYNPYENKFEHNPEPDTYDSRDDSGYQ